MQGPGSGREGGWQEGVKEVQFLPVSFSYWCDFILRYNLEYPEKFSLKSLSFLLAIRKEIFLCYLNNLGTSDYLGKIKPVVKEMCLISNVNTPRDFEIPLRTLYFP